jgi:outer membrane receptor protein involved in Fe transport
MAQEAGLTVAPANHEVGTKLEEIVVTATRREESVEKVPISISALSQQDLAEGNIKSIADIAAITPGLQFATPNSFASTITTISIRGMNTQVGASVVGIYLDDTPVMSRLPAIGNVGVTFPLVFDLNRVEVERGPQGTLFGAGSEAGAVRFISNSPSLTDFGGFTHAEVSSTEGGTPSAEIGAAGGGPIVADKLGFRVSTWYHHDGGYVDHIDPLTGQVIDQNANADRKLALRGALAYQVNDQVRVTPSLYYQAVDTDDSSRFYGYYSDAPKGVFTNGALLPERSTDHLTVASVKADAHLSFAELTAVGSYMNRQVDLSRDLSMYYGAFVGGFGSPVGIWFPTSPSDVMPLTNPQSIKGYTEEIRLASNQPDSFITWVAGIFNDHRTQVDSQSITGIFIDPTGAPFYYIREQTTDDQIAAFGQVDLHLTKKWTLTLGERVAKVQTHESDYNGNGSFNGGEPPVAYTTIKQTPNTPKLSVSYQLNPDNLLYASAGKGFRVGGGNAPLPNTCNETAPPYGADYVWSYEVGAKNQLFDHRVQIDSSVFHIKWSNIQQLVLAPCNVSYTANAGIAISKGFDIAVQMLVTDALRINLDVGYVDAYFQNDVFAAGLPLVLAGDKVGLLPQVNSPWDVNTAANYDIPFANGGKVHLRGEFQYHSRNPGPFITQISNSPNYAPLNVADPPTHMTNLRIGYTQGGVDLTLFLNNAFNSRPNLGSFQLPSASNLVTYGTFRPRTIGLSANWEF